MLCAGVLIPERGITASTSTLRWPVGVTQSNIVASARKWFFAFRSGSVDRRDLSETVNEELTDSLLRNEMNTLKGLGKPTAFAFLRTETVAGLAGYEVVVSFAGTDRKVIEGIAFDDDNKLAGIDFEIVAPGDPTSAKRGAI